MMVCIQCALEAFVRELSAAEMAQASRFDESPEEHLRRVHPDPIVTHLRRRELERLATVRILRENRAVLQDHDGE